MPTPLRPLLERKRLSHRTRPTIQLQSGFPFCLSLRLLLRLRSARDDDRLPQTLSVVSTMWLTSLVAGDGCSVGFASFFFGASAEGVSTLSDGFNSSVIVRTYPAPSYRATRCWDEHTHGSALSVRIAA